MQTLLDIWNEDTYDRSAARALISSLYDQFQRVSSDFGYASLDEFELIEFGNLASRGFSRLVSLMDAFHPKGEWRLMLHSEGEIVTRATIDAYLRGDDMSPIAESPLLASHRRAADVLLDSLGERARTYGRSARKRIKDFYALSALCTGDEKPYIDIVVAIVLEASHRLDDYYDSKPKWYEYGHRSPEEAIDEALLSIDELLAGKAYREETLRQVKSCLEYVDTWVGGDARASGLNLEDDKKRILDCNADLYRRFFSMCRLATDIDESMESVFESFGALIWILDDWRDVEADALNDHFNVFTAVRMNLSAQVELLKTYAHDLIRDARAQLEPEQLEEFMNSAGITPTMRRCLELT